MVDDQSDGDLQLLSQFFVDLTDGEFISDTKADKNKGTCQPPSLRLYTHFLDDVVRQPGQDSDREPEMSDGVHQVLGHRRRQAGLRGDGLHPLGEVVGQGQDVAVPAERRRQRPSDVQPEPLPRRRHLPTRRRSARPQPLGLRGQQRRREAVTYLDQPLRIFAFCLKIKHNKTINTFNMSQAEKTLRTY